MGYLHQALSAIKHKIGDDLVDHNDSNVEANLDKRKQRDIDNNTNISLSTDDLINCITTPEVINEMTAKVLQKIGISRTDDVPLESWPTQDKKIVPLSKYNFDRSCHSSGSCRQLNQLGKTQSSDEWKIQSHPPCKKICLDEESNKE